MCGSDTPFDFAQGRLSPALLGLGLMFGVMLRWLLTSYQRNAHGVHDVDIGLGMPKSKAAGEGARPTLAHPDLYPAQAEEVLQELAGVFTQTAGIARRIVYPPEQPAPAASDPQLPNLEARYRALVEQIPAVVFMAYLDRGIGEAYVSPQIEAALGFSQEEWL